MRAITLHQPWASLIAVGAKRIETRSWPTPYRGWLAIHAGKTFPPDAERLCLQRPFSAALLRAGLPSLPRGAVVAVAHLHRVGRIGRRADGAVIVDGRDLPVEGDELAFGDYTPNRFGWVLTNVHPLPAPIPCRGMQGLWPVPDEVQAAIRAALPGVIR
jgi:activating signal cointegrator 1